MGAALWRRVVQCARHGRIWRGLRRLRQYPGPDQYAASAYRTALSRLPGGRCFCVRVDPGSPCRCHHYCESGAGTPGCGPRAPACTRSPGRSCRGDQAMKIRLDRVVKTFQTFRAVREVSLDIGSGELVALLGPSGSGKTTILRMVAGLEYADGGHIYFGEQDATDIPVRDRGV